MKKQYFLLIIVMFSIFSCEELLDKQPYDVVSEQTFWQTSTDAKAGLVACYDALRSSADHDVFSWERFAAFDLLTPIGMCRNGAVESLTRGNTDATNVMVERGWRSHYRGLVRCNDFLSHIDNINFSENEAELKLQMVGEAHFLRAMYAFALTTVWGDVPYFEYVPGMDDIHSERTPQSVIIEKIKADL